MRIRQNQHGQGTVEYALILIGVSIVVILTLNIAGVSLRDVYCQVVSGLGDAGCKNGSDCRFSFDDSESLDAWDGENKENMFIENGKACIAGDGKSARSYLNSKCVSNLGSNDYIIDLSDITVEKTAENNKNTGFDVWFRAADDQNGYLFVYNSRTNYIRFWKIVDGRWIRLSQSKVSEEWKNQEFDIKIEVSEGKFTAYKDGEAVLQATDNAYIEGQIGIRNKPSSKSCVGNIVIENHP
jgi:hypothetical protein